MADNEPQKAEEIAPSRESVKKGKSNRGCWIVAGIGCGVMLVLAGVVSLFFIAFLVSEPVSTASYYEEVIYDGGEDRIAVIPIEGMIMQGGGEADLLGTSLSTSDALNEQLEQASADDSVKAIILKMNTPGGDAVASDLVYRKVVEVSEEKPIITWISGMGASGGYYIAVGSDEIIAHPGAITGSIGTILQVTNLEGLYEKVGIDIRTFKSGEFKDNEGLFDENPDGEADQILQSLVDESYADFVDIVANEREMAEDEVRRLADGRLYSGKQAQDNGLVDSLGYEDDAIAKAEELSGSSDMTIITYSSGGLLESLYGYKTSLLSSLGLLSPGTDVGVHVLYLLDI